MVKKDLSDSDIRCIINKLVNFIVVEGKEFVPDEKKDEYVSSYLYLLIKTIHFTDKEEYASLVETISKDINKHVQ